MLMLQTYSQIAFCNLTVVCLLQNYIVTFYNIIIVCWYNLIQIVGTIFCYNLFQIAFRKPNCAVVNPSRDSALLYCVNHDEEKEERQWRYWQKKKKKNNKINYHHDDVNDRNYKINHNNDKINDETYVKAMILPSSPTSMLLPLSKNGFGLANGLQEHRYVHKQWV